MPSPRWSLAALAGASLLVSQVAFAEPSAADKAAARQTATEGIQLFKAQKYAEALERLRRAQALYDAPVHLLYMARAEEKLGLLVEASEHYRQLDHYALPANPPEAWTAAVEDGRKEFATVEPRVPNLRVLTEPAVQSAALRIDGVDVSSAAIGIPRPINPGQHRVELATPGKAFSATDVTVAEGTTRDVVFKVDGAAAPVVTTGVVAGTQPEQSTPAGEEKEGPFVGFLAGMRLGLSVPFGTLFHYAIADGVGTDIASSDYRSAGAGIEFHAGIRLGKYFTPIFFLEGSTLGHPSYGPFGGADREIKSTQAGSFGIGVLIGTPPGKIGGFGEFGIGLIDAASVQFGNAKIAPSFDIPQCKVEARGASLRFGGGATIPVVKWLQLSPVALVSVGRFTNLDLTNCGDVTLPSDIAGSDQRTHGMFFIGVGGDVVVGGRR